MNLHFLLLGCVYFSTVKVNKYSNYMKNIQCNNLKTYNGYIWGTKIDKKILEPVSETQMIRLAGSNLLPYPRLHKWQASTCDTLF